MAMNPRWVVLLAVGGACATREPRRLVVPEGMRRPAQPAVVPDAQKPAAPGMQGLLQPATARPAAPDGRYVLRLAGHNRVWGLELPEAAGGYEMSISLARPLPPPTLPRPGVPGTAPRGTGQPQSRPKR